MKINVCDICHSEGKLVETTLYRKVTGRTDLRLDVCETCDRTRIQKSMVDYVKLVYKVTLGMDLSDEDAKRIAKR